MDVTMKATLTLKLCVAALLLVAAQAVVAQNIYKCTQGGQLEYTDHPCPGGKGELIHQADDREVIDHYLNLGQVDVAKRYADAHHLDALYKDRLASYQQKMDDKAQQQADDGCDNQRANRRTCVCRHLFGCLPGLSQDSVDHHALRIDGGFGEWNAFGLEPRRGFQIFLRGRRR